MDTWAHVNTHCLMLEVLRYIAYIPFNACVKCCTKDQSNVCMSKMSKIVLSKMCLFVLFPSSTSSTYIALQPLGAFDLSLTSSICFNIHSIGWYGWKVSAFQNFLRIENWLNIKKVMSINVSVCSFPIFDICSITALRCI